MLTLLFLAIVLTLALGAFAALGVEDAKFHASLQPIRYDASPEVMTWEASLPGKPALPWSEDKK